MSRQNSAILICSLFRCLPFAPTGAFFMLAYSGSCYTNTCLLLAGLPDSYWPPPPSGNCGQIKKSRAFYMTLPVHINNSSSQFGVTKTNKQFAVAESRAELDSVCNLPITKNIGDSLQVISSRKFGANWSGFMKSKNDPDWACFSEAALIANDFVKYIADKSPASDPIHENVDNYQVITDAVNYIHRKINVNKLENNGYLNDKAKLFGALVELVPSLSEHVYKGINRSIKYFADQRENFSYLSDDQFAQFQKDYTNKIKDIGPGIVDAVTIELKELLEGVRNV